jgi:lysyl-tRNA synthetase class 2
LVEVLLGISHFEYVSYRQLFEQYLGINPFTISNKALISEARQLIDVSMPYATRDDWLNLLLSHLIEPNLAFDAPVFVYDYPPSQAALARINRDEQGQEVAERFELYYKSLELCNGYHELTDAAAQKERFHYENQQRLVQKKQALPIDYALLAALEKGLPVCAGVALGLDRLLMLKLRAENITEVLALG